MNWSLTPLAIDSAAELRDWRGIAAHAAIRHPLLDGDYLELVLRHMAPGKKLYWLRYALAGRTEIIGILERRTAGRWQSWYMPQLPVTPLVCALPAGASQCAGEGLFAALPGAPWQLKLFDVDRPYVAAPERLTSLAQAEVLTHQTIAIDLVRGADDYWQSRSRDLQRNVARSIRKLNAESGAAQLYVVESAGEMAAAVAAHAALEQSGWKGAHGSAMRADDSLGVFYRAVLEFFAARGRARVYQLRIGDAVIASQLCISSDSILATMKTSYHGRYASCSPGRMLDYLMLQHLQSDPVVDRCEFCVHAGKADLQWATEARSLRQVEFYRGAGLKDLVVRGRWLVRRFTDRAAPAAGAA